MTLEELGSEREENNVDIVPYHRFLKPIRFLEIRARCDSSADFEAAVAWYSDKLDFRLIKSSPLGDKLYGFLIAPAVEAVFTVELVAGPGAENRLTYDNLASSLKLSGLHHLSFRVDSVDDAITELKRRSVRILSEPHDVPKLNLRVAFFADPWGNLFEVIQAMRD